VLPEVVRESDIQGLLSYMENMLALSLTEC
jgi:hypothetical protein